MILAHFLIKLAGYFLGGLIIFLRSLAAEATPRAWFAIPN